MAYNIKHLRIANLLGGGGRNQTPQSLIAPYKHFFCEQIPVQVNKSPALPTRVDQARAQSQLQQEASVHSSTWDWTVWQLPPSNNIYIYLGSQAFRWLCYCWL